MAFSLKQWLSKHAPSSPVISRAMSAYRLMDKIYNELSWEYRMIDVLIEGGGYVVMYMDWDANLYVARVSLDGDDVVLEDGMRVQESYELLPQSPDETERSATLRGTIQIIRQDDGSAKWVMRASVAVINRVLEIDSTKLFDTMIDRFNSGDYDTPYLTFRHMSKGGFYMGDVEFLARDGYVLVASGTYDTDEDNVLSRNMQESLDREPEYWGVSIGFRLEETDPEPDTITHTIRAGDMNMDLEIPVYNEGTLIECSILAEKDCASYFTAVQNVEVIETMSRKIKTRDARPDLLVVFNGDEEALDTFLAGNDDINTEIEERGLIARSGKSGGVKSRDGESDVDEPEQDEGTPEGDEPESNIEVDDDVMSELVSGLANNPDFASAVASAMTDGGDIDDTLRAVIGRSLVRIGALEDAVDELADSQGEVAELFDLDSPRKFRLSKSGSSGSSRPSKRHENEKSRKGGAKSESFDDLDDEEINAALDGIASELV